MKSLFGEGKGGYGSVPDGDEEKTSINPAKSTVEVILGEEGSKERELILHPTMREKEHKKITKLLDAATDRAPPAVVGYLKSAQPCVAGCVVGCEMCVPIYARVYALGARFVAALPQEELGMLLGLLLCFFGGLYPMTLAAVEALRQCGGAQFYEACHDLQVQFLNAKAASDADDLVDEDGDGVADVEQISAQSLAARKTMIVLRSTDPHTCDLALKSVYASLAAVVAVLKLRFARTIALGAAIGDFLTTCLTTPATHVLVHVLEPDVHKWVPAGVSYVCKLVAVLIAWHIQKIITALYSALRGGLLVSRNALRKLSVLNLVHIKPEDTYLDELSGWALGAFGFWVQWKLGFAAPFLITILLWPIACVEAALVWAVYS